MDLCLESTSELMLCACQQQQQASLGTIFITIWIPGWHQFDLVNFAVTYLQPAVQPVCADCSIPFFVAAPTTTLDPNMASGSEITIEQRPANEITHYQGRQVAPEGIQVHLLASCIPLLPFIAKSVRDCMCCCLEPSIPQLS